MGRPTGVSPYSMPNFGYLTCSIERVRHCLIPSVRDEGRPLLSLVVAVVVLKRTSQRRKQMGTCHQTHFEVINAPIGECLGVLFLYSQRCSCSISVFITTGGISTMVSYRIVHMCISQQRNTFPTPTPYHELFPQALGSHLGIWWCLLGEYRLRICRRTNSRLG